MKCLFFFSLDKFLRELTTGAIADVVKHAAEIPVDMLKMSTTVYTAGPERPGSPGAHEMALI